MSSFLNELRVSSAYPIIVKRKVMVVLCHSGGKEMSIKLLKNMSICELYAFAYKKELELKMESGGGLI